MILLDTHVWVRWLVPGAVPLPATLTERIAVEDRVAVSAISHWEVAQLVLRDRVALPMALSDWLMHASEGSGIETISLTGAVASRSAMLTQHHRDPADRFIIATAIENAMPLMSLDSQFSHYPEIADLLVRF